MLLTPQQPGVTARGECCQPGKLGRDLQSRVFIGGWSHSQPLPDTCLAPGLPEGKGSSAHTMLFVPTV